MNVFQVNLPDGKSVLVHAEYFDTDHETVSFFDPDDERIAYFPAVTFVREVSDGISPLDDQIKKIMDTHGKTAVVPPMGTFGDPPGLCGNPQANQPTLS